MGAVRVLIADGHEVTRIGIRAALARTQNYEVCAEAADGRAAVEKARRFAPNRVILDVDLLSLDGLQAACRIKSDARIPILIFTDISSERMMQKVLEFKIDGFVLKSDPLSDLMVAAEAVVQGGASSRHL